MQKSRESAKKLTENPFVDTAFVKFKFNDFLKFEHVGIYGEFPISRF